MFRTGASAATQIYDETVTKILHYTNYAVVFYEPSQSNAEGCTYTHQDKSVVIDWTSTDNNKFQLSTALAALAAGKTVNFGLSGCFPGSSPIAYRIEIED